MYGGLFALRILARKYEFRDEDERAPLVAIINATFPVLLQIMQQLMANPAPGGRSSACGSSHELNPPACMRVVMAPRVTVLQCLG